MLTGGTLFGHSAVLFVTGRGQLEVVVPDGQEVEAKPVVRRGQQIVEIVDLRGRRKKSKRIAVEIGEFGTPEPPRIQMPPEPLGFHFAFRFRDCISSSGTIYPRAIR